MKVIGIDIGTTKICALVLQTDTGEVLEIRHLANDTSLWSAHPWEKTQDPARILAKAEELADGLIKAHRPIGAIGITGQMHGIVYIDAQGTAVSPLYTWEDSRGSLPFQEDDATCADILSRQTGYKLATGYGMVTHACNLQRHLVPPEAVSMCTILGFVAMRMAGRATPVLHTSDAAGLGMFDLPGSRFDRDALRIAGLDAGFLPEVSGESIRIGRTREGIPVVIAIGDNQASFIGSVNSMNNSILVNIGTGSQISLYSGTYVRDSVMETRPCPDNAYLLVGASLCGGRAFQVLESFFQSVLQMAGHASPCLYPAMDKLAEDYGQLEEKLAVATQFSGTRADHALRGAIRNIGIGNLTARHMIVGVLEGIADELYRFYSQMDSLPDNKPTLLVGSGNGIRRNPVMQRMLSAKFGMPLKIPLYLEEASFGAAMFSAVGAGFFSTIGQAQAMIRYREGNV